MRELSDNRLIEGAFSTRGVHVLWPKLIIKVPRCPVCGCPPPSGLMRREAAGRPATSRSSRLNI